MLTPQTSYRAEIKGQEIRISNLSIGEHVSYLTQQDMFGSVKRIKDRSHWVVVFNTPDHAVAEAMTKNLSVSIFLPDRELTVEISSVIVETSSELASMRLKAYRVEGLILSTNPLPIAPVEDLPEDFLNLDQELDYD